MGIEDEAAGRGGIARAHNVGSREEVDEITEQARAAVPLREQRGRGHRPE
jgi:hypothetical protein